MTIAELLIEELGSGNFARNLRVLRVLRGFEQRELAQRAGIGYDTISRLENDLQKPRPGSVKKLADALQVPQETLIGSSE
jgi:transcriptional regulator with XRE-family HTH domain